MDRTFHRIYCLARLLCCFLVTMVFHTSLSYAQYENVWIFGRNAGLDFNGPVPTALLSNIGTFPPTVGEASASVCDAGGQLLFYTEGWRVFDKDHKLMPNGNNLVPVVGQGSLSPTTSTSQGAVIVPTAHPDQYYIFSLTARELSTAAADNGGRLYYSIVDMSINGGWGDVVAGAKGVLVDSNLTEQMTAVIGDYCKIWLLTISQTRELKAFEITSDGSIRAPVVSTITNIPINNEEAGYIAVSPDRKKIAITQLAQGVNGLAIFDFDPVSGTISNGQQLSPSASGYGVCFSPDNTKLYFNESSSGGGSIYQFNLAAGNLTDIVNSKTYISPSHTHTHLKLAPDNKIYFNANTTIASNGILSFINAPDQPGLACFPQINAVPLLLQTFMYIGLPNAVPVIPRDTVHTKTDTRTCGTHIILTPGEISGSDYLWNDSVTDISRSVTRSGTYWVSYKAPCRYVYHTDTFEVAMFPPYHDSFTRVICANEPFDFNGRLLHNPGKYHDTLVTANGCDSIITLDLIVLPTPEVSVSAADLTADLCLDDTVLLTATGAGRYEWYRNDLLVGISNREQIYLPDLSNKIIVVGLTADNDCRDTAAVVINVHDCPAPPCDLFVPNAFSPNGDGVNDGFTAVPHRSSDIRGYRMELFNRWGQLVFSASDISIQWDGIYNGAPADVGVYFYYITAECREGAGATLKGDVTLIR